MSLIEMSLSGGAIILALLLLRALAMYKLPKRLLAALWSLPLIRLLVPFSIPAPFSVYTLLERQKPIPPVTHSAPPAVLSPDILPGGPATAQPPTAFSGTSIDPLPLIWLIGALAFGAFFAAAYVRCRREFRESLPVDNGFTQAWLAAHRLRRGVSIRCSDRVSAPLTYGVLRPVILLPSSADWSDADTLGYVLAHELAHIRRLDALRKPIIALALCVHWFNPLAWAMYFLANRDIELACDEAVLGQGAGRSEYALALIRMEERRSGLSLGSHFSKNSIEERIQAIMKINKRSLAALLAALILTGGSTALFATSAKAENTDGGGAQTADVIESSEASTNPLVEWWTAEEYAEWLENEKINLQDSIGSRGWTPSTGWFTWTPEMVEETIAQYEEILAQIKEGYLVSKSVDGDENTMLMSGGPMQATTVEEDDKIEKLKMDRESLFEKYDESLFNEYKRCGLTFKNNDGDLYWNGQRVRIFVDGADYGDGFASRYEHYDPEGVVDLHTVRERIDNPDGSFDPMGKLVRIEEFEPEQMFLDALDCQKYVDAEIDYEIGRTTQALEYFERFGLTYQTDSHTGKLSMTWNGQPVRSLFDPECQLWIANSLGAKGMDLEVVYKDGEITGLRESQESASVHAGAVIDAEATAAESDGDDGSGETIAQRMERYAPYGVSYQEIGGKRVIRYNGMAVRNFADFAPGGSVFSVGSTDGGEINLVTVYDNDGRLSGVKAAKG